MEVLHVPIMPDSLADAAVRKPLDVYMSISVIRSHADLEFLVSRWSTEAATSVTSWGESLLSTGRCFSDVPSTYVRRRGCNGPCLSSQRERGGCNY